MKWNSEFLTDEEDLELHRRDILAMVEGLRFVEFRKRRRIPFWKKIARVLLLPASRLRRRRDDA